MKKKKISIIILLALLFTISTHKKASAEKFSINFKDIEIRDLIKLISDWTGKNFLIDNRVRGTITIISPKEVTKEEALQIFQSILFANDLATVEVGKITKIVPAAESRQSTIPTYFEDTTKPVKLLPSEMYITRVIPLNYINAQQVSDILRNLVSRNGFLQVYQPTNTIILIDTIANSQRLLEIIEKVDIPLYEQKIEFIKLEYALAQDVANILTQIFSAVGPAGAATRGVTPPKIIAHTATNSIIILATEEDILRMKGMIKNIDIKSEEGKVYVINIKYAKAEEVAQILNQLAAGARAGAPAAPGQAPAIVQAGVRIAADKSTNSLIIVSSPQDFESIKNVVDSLDVQRKQIFVEAVIMEASLRKLAELGLSYLAGKDITGIKLSKDGEDKAAIVGTVSVGAPVISTIDQSTLANLAAIQGMMLGFVGPNVKIELSDGTKINLPGVSTILKALATDSEVEILSTPQILATDNKEAQITVAQNIPFPTGQVIPTTTGAPTYGAYYPTISIERQDVGIILKITPHTIGDEKVQLDINVEISDVAEEIPAGLVTAQLGIATLKRSANTSVLVKDAQTVVIGGLMRTRKAISKQKVPFLGDIPVIGWLFRSTKKTSEKSNLLIFITPKIIKTTEELENIKTLKIEEDIEFRKKEGIK